MRLIEHSPKRWASNIRNHKPIAESIIPLDSRERRRWSSKEDAWLVEYARLVMKIAGISEVGKINNIDPALYSVLCRRKLIGKLRLKEKRKTKKELESMDEDELIEFAKKYLKENKISTKNALAKSYRNLYKVLYLRKLQDSVGLKIKRNFSAMSHEEIVGLAKKKMEEEGLTKRSHLQKADGTLYGALSARGLLDAVGFDDKRRVWRNRNDKELIEHANRYIKREGISTIMELNEKDSGLHQVLYKRGILDKVRFEKRIRKWHPMDNDSLIAHTRSFMEERGITGRAELCRVDSGLYTVLRDRKLLDSVGFRVVRKKWSRLKKDELFEYAVTFLEERGITEREELKKEDRSLFYALKRREIMATVFSKIEEAKQKQGLQEISEAMGDFGGEE